MRDGVAELFRLGNPPDGLSPSGASGVLGSFMFDQQGWRIVMARPAMLATPQRGCVQAP